MALSVDQINYTVNENYGKARQCWSAMSSSGSF